MKIILASALHRLARWLAPKSMPPGLAGSSWTGASFVDAFRRHRAPSANELLAELKSTAYVCATLNASVCASFPPRLYVKTERDQPAPRCATRPLHPADEKRLADRCAKAAHIEEVIDHPLLDLLRQVNPIHNGFDLFELTTLYQEVQGCAYWLLRFGPLGIPEEVWILPSQNVRPCRAADSQALVDYYEYRAGADGARFRPDEIIHFRYPDPRDPYMAGLGPLRAAWEEVALSSEYNALRRARFENRAIPDAIVSPAEVIGEEERDRLEAQWNQKFRRGGAGRVLVAESGLNVQMLNPSMGDLAQLAEASATRETIANAFGVPIAFLTSETNLANLQAAEHQHLAKTILPRLRRRDEKLNEQLVPLFDPSGRLFVASDDPTPANQEQTLKEQEAYLKLGVLTINEVRQERGLPSVSWGDKPWLPRNWTSIA